MTSIQVVSVEEALEYLGIDYADDMVIHNVERAINTSDAYLRGSIGDNYPVEDSRCKELALILVQDLYDNRGLATTSYSNNTRKLVDDLSLQLRLELRREGNEI